MVYLNNVPLLREWELYLLDMSSLCAYLQLAPHTAEVGLDLMLF